MGTILLRSEELCLRKHRMEDAQVLHRILGQDPEISRYTGWNPYFTPEMAQETVNRFISSYADAHFYGWAVEAGGELIGTIGAYDYDPGQKSVEIGYSIARTFWGKGYASGAAALVLEHLEQEGIRLVKAWCEADNIGSARVLEKNHFVCTGEHVEEGKTIRCWERRFG